MVLYMNVNNYTKFLKEPQENIEACINRETAFL